MKVDHILELGYFRLPWHSLVTVLSPDVDNVKNNYSYLCTKCKHTIMAGCAVWKQMDNRIRVPKLFLSLPVHPSIHPCIYFQNTCTFHLFLLTGHRCKALATPHLHGSAWLYPSAEASPIQTLLNQVSWGQCPPCEEAARHSTMQEVWMQKTWSFQRLVKQVRRHIRASLSIGLREKIKK